MRKNTPKIVAHRELILGLAGGLLGGLLFTLGQHADLSRLHFMNPGVVPGVSASTNVLVVAGGICGQLIAPVLVSALARRHFFGWGLLPIALFNFWCLADSFTHSDWGNATIFRLILLFRIPVVWLFVCGPVALLRMRRQRIRQRQEAQFAQSTTVEEGVWPPPPMR